MGEDYSNAAYEGQYAYPEPEPKKKLSGWLIALIVIVVLIIACCLCGLVAMLLAGPAIGNSFSTVIESIEIMTPMP